MTAVAVFDVWTNESPEVIRTKLIELWVWKQVDILVDSQTKFTTCIIKYIFYQLEEEQSIKNIVEYLLNISRNGCIYYYPSWDVYSAGSERILVSSKYFKLINQFLFPHCYLVSQRNHHQ
jgi:hypothetical protein